jgi:5'-3' exonuclease
MKNKYSDLLKNLSNQKTEKPAFNSRPLIVDGLNTFLRNFSAINHVNPNLQHVGGLTGFLKSIGYVIKLVQPSRVVLVFDGVGASSTKKLLFSEYKANRNLAKIMNWDVFETKEEEKESMTNQLLRLISYLQLLPVTLLSIDKIEADDVIGYLTCNTFKESDSVTILSADKDFYQLINDKVQVYNPFKKYCFNPKEVLETFGVTALNFPLYKTILGDSSDNIPGVKGIGEKKLLKLFPFLKEDQYFDLNYLLQYSKDNVSEHYLYERVLLFENQLKINYQLIVLKDQPIMEASIEEIDYISAELPPKLNSQKFLTMYENDQLGNTIPRVSSWLQEVFLPLNQ